MRVLFDFARKVFRQEEETVVAWFQRNKVLFILLFLLIIGTWGYFKWPSQAQIIINLAKLYSESIIIAWLVILTLYLYTKEREPKERIFRDNFKHGLQRWEYFGDWKIEKEDGHHILIVRKSDIGGFALPCRQWIDYLFEFETKIVQANTSWIIRAADIHNYVLLQCSTTEINPHYRVNGLWVKLESVKLQTPLPLNTWFKVQIKAQGTRVVVKAAIEGKEKILLDSYLLEPTGFVAEFSEGDVPRKLDLFGSFPAGSVGFREAGLSECAHFRDVRVTKL